MSSKTILVLEDEAVIRNLCSRLLAKRDCKVLFAERVEEALAHIASGTVDLLITDLKLPDGNGADVIRRVHDKFPKTRVLVMTGSLSPDERLDQVRDLNVIDILFKPFDIGDFEKALQKALG